MVQSDLLNKVVPGNQIIRNGLIRAVQFLLKVGVALEITGLNNIPPTGSLVVIINHISFWDPVLILAVFPRLLIPMAKAEILQSWIWRWIVKSYGAIPIHRNEGDMKAVKSALRILKQGGAILLAPEGTRSSTYQMQQAKDGATILALRSNAQILPIAITGTHQIKAHITKFKRSPVHCLIGKPFRLQSSSGNNRPPRAEISTITEQIMYRLAGQLPPEFRGVYNNVETATDTHLIL